MRQEKTDTLQDLATPEMQFSRFFTALTYHGPPEASSFSMMAAFLSLMNQKSGKTPCEATLSHFIRLDCMDVGSTLRG